MAGSVSSRSALTADLDRPGASIGSQLPGAASDSHCRPFAGTHESPESAPALRCRRCTRRTTMAAPREFRGNGDALAHFEYARVLAPRLELSGQCHLVARQAHDLLN